MLIHLLSSIMGLSALRSHHKEHPTRAQGSVHTASVGQFTWVAQNLSLIALASNSALRSQVMACSREVKTRPPQSTPRVTLFFLFPLLIFILLLTICMYVLVSKCR